MKMTGCTIKKMSTSVDGGYVISIDIPENNYDAAKDLFIAPKEVSYSVEIEKEA